LTRADGGEAAIANNRTPTVDWPAPPPGDFLLCVFRSSFRSSSTFDFWRFEIISRRYNSFTTFAGEAQTLH
jgi:hypothetical protein